jgi:hypothetical protein
MSQYPEHDKLVAVQEQSQTIGEFLEWLTGVKGYRLARHVVMEPDRSFAPELGKKRGREVWRIRVTGDPFRDYEDSWYDTEEEAQGECERLAVKEQSRMEDNPRLVVDFPDVEFLLAEHFGIDRRALEREKRAMLASLPGRA